MPMRALSGSLLCLTIPFAGCAAAPPSADEVAVLATVQAFFDVIASQDAAAGARLVVPEGAFVSVRAVDGRRVLRPFRNADWLAQLRGEAGRQFEAFVGEPTVLVEGDVAIVWGRYVFELDGARSHTGVDAIHLVRTDDGWRISGGAYTVVRDDPAR